MKGGEKKKEVKKKREKMIRKREKRKALSPVIATVLLVLLTFLAVGIVWRFILPMVRTGLEGEKSCFDLRDYGKVSESSFTCYNASETKTRLMIERGMEDIEIKGFSVSIISEGEAKRFDIVSNSNASDFEMWDGTAFATTIEVPNPGEAKSYRFSVADAKKASLGILTKSGKVCSVGTYDIPEC